MHCAWSRGASVHRIADTRTTVATVPGEGKACEGEREGRQERREGGGESGLVLLCVFAVNTLRTKKHPPVQAPYLRTGLLLLLLEQSDEGNTRNLRSTM